MIIVAARQAANQPDQTPLPFLYIYDTTKAKKNDLERASPKKQTLYILSEILHRFPILIFSLISHISTRN